MFEKCLILDTCAILWLASEAKEISKDTLFKIDSAELVMISPISIWEISLKVEKGGIVLPIEINEWVERVIENHNLIVVPLDTKVMICSCKLPWYHNDPADRFIIATAIQENATVVTADKRFKDYGVKVII
ncbi:MAG: type II toxin-antitoxin system VapC family toxin [Fibrobacter sp.]|nr:type II toxin-antitoxin system VapC family toxin [Fibrobacter sp.]